MCIRMYVNMNILSNSSVSGIKTEQFSVNCMYKHARKSACLSLRGLHVCVYTYVCICMYVCACVYYSEIQMQPCMQKYMHACMCEKPSFRCLHLKFEIQMLPSEYEIQMLPSEIWDSGASIWIWDSDGNIYANIPTYMHTCARNLLRNAYSFLRMYMCMYICMYELCITVTLA